jgi:hypothetical protein
MKTCSCCKKEKPLSEFGLLKSTKDGHRYDCKECKKERGRADRLKNKKPKKENYSYPVRTIFCMGCGVEHTGHFSHMTKFCSDDCSSESIKRSNRNSKKNSTYVENNIDKVRETKLKSYHKLKNSVKRKNYQKSYSQRLDVRLRNALRARVKKSLKTNQKTTSTISLIGCSIHELKIHIESQFKTGMTWDNWEQFGWHLDHKIPLASAKNKEEMFNLCHYTNLQPLWWRDNISKRDKILENTDNNSI